MGLSKTNEHIQIKIKIPNSSQEPIEDLEDIDVLCTFKIKVKSQNLDHGCIKEQWPYPNEDKDAKPKHEPPAFFRYPNQDLKDMDIDMDVLCNFKIKMMSW